MINKKKLKNILVIGIVAAITLTMAGCKKPGNGSGNGNGNGNGNNSGGTEVEIDIEDVEVPSDAVSSGYSGSYIGKITFEGTKASVEGEGVSVSGAVATIEKSGTFVVTGVSGEGQIIINVTKNDKINLVLDGIQLTSKTSSPIQVISADKTTIVMPEGSVNILTMEGGTVTDENGDPDAALWSKDDLAFEGDGSLYVVSATGKGIHSKDDIKIKGGNIYVTSADDGVKGNDSVTVSSGNLVIETQADGIKSDNEEDAEKGYVEISGGKISITSKQDGIQGFSYVKISDGEISISTNGGSSANTEQKGDNFGGGGNGGPGGNWGGPGGRRMSYESSTDLYESSTGTMNLATKTATTTTSDTSDSSKGIKSETSIVISGGTIVIDSYDDAIHSDNTVTIDGGIIKASAGDDGLHGDKILTINGGEVYVTKSYEGLEAQVVNLCGGYINITASDDGINAAGKSSSTSGSTGGFFGGGGGGMGEVDSDANLNITGGSGIINAGGDGVDSNNTITMSGGDYVVYGPTDNGNGAIDYETSFVMTGGSFAAFGSTGMAEGISSGSTVGYLFVGLTSSADKNLVIKSSDGTTVFENTSPKQYGCVFVSNPNIIAGETYTFILDGEELGSVAAK